MRRRRRGRGGARPPRRSPAAAPSGGSARRRRARGRCRTRAARARTRSSGGCATRVGVLLVAVELDDHQPADVVQQGRDRELVAAAGAGRARRPARRRCERRRRGGGSAPGARPSAPGCVEEVVGLELARRASGSRRGCSSSTASRTPPTRPAGPPPLLAARMTAIASAASDSIASETSPGDGALALADVEQPASRLGQRRQRGHRLECVGQATPAGACARSPPRWGLALSS